MTFLLATGLLEKIWNDPFEYAFGVIMVVGAIGVAVRYGKEVWEEITGED